MVFTWKFYTINNEKGKIDYLRFNCAYAPNQIIAKFN